MEEFVQGNKRIWMGRRDSLLIHGGGNRLYFFAIEIAWKLERIETFECGG
jgi:hypothetical protein